MSSYKCDGCGETLPISMFPDLGEHGFVCVGCLAGNDTTGLAEAMEEKAKQVAVDLVSLTGDEIAQELPRVRQVLSEVYREFGGPSTFANTFFSLITKLSERRPLPASAAQLMLSFMKLHQQTESASEAIAASKMSDEELRRATELETIRMVVEAAADSKKLQTLRELLARYGFNLQKADPDEILAIAEQRLLEDSNTEDDDVDEEADKKHWANGSTGGTTN